MIPPISGDRSDGAVFRGLNNSTEGSGGFGSQSHIEKLKVEQQPAESLIADENVESKDPLNKTHDSIHDKSQSNKERNLLEMFKEQASDNEKNDMEKKEKENTDGEEEILK